MRYTPEEAQQFNAQYPWSKREKLQEFKRLQGGLGSPTYFLAEALTGAVSAIAKMPVTVQAEAVPLQLACGNLSREIVALHECWQNQIAHLDRCSAVEVKSLTFEAMETQQTTLLLSVTALMHLMKRDPLLFGPPLSALQEALQTVRLTLSAAQQQAR